MTGTILVIDEGTTSTRAMLFRPDGTLLGCSQRDITQYYPAPGHVEHDAIEIWTKTLSCAREMVERAGGASRISALGIANQRETVVAWDKQTGKSIGRAIVWQDRRTAGICSGLKERGVEPLIQANTGLLLDPYFSASKMRWMLENEPRLQEAGDRLAFGTIESYLIYRLTGGQHVSDASNASRTMLMTLDAMDWDEELLDLFGVKRNSLPAIIDCAGNIGCTLPQYFGAPIAICGAAGDQQAATIGQSCCAPGETKATFGTGAFILANSGTQIPRSRHRLLSTVLYQIDGIRHYALEGAVFVAGSLIKWLRDELKLLHSAEEIGDLASTVPDNGGVFIVPALSGLGAPHWRPEARGMITGLSLATKRAHIARAALESVTHLTHDLKMAFAADGVDWECLKIDGGMTANDWLVQDLANILDLTVERPQFVETTALGAAMLAGVGSGIFKSLEEAAAMRQGVQHFTPRISPSTRRDRLTGWADTLTRL